MFFYSIIFYLLVITSCVGAGFLMWSIVIKRITSDKNGYSIPSSIELGIVGIFTIGIFATLLNFVLPISRTLSAFLFVSFFIAGLINLIRTQNVEAFRLLALTAVVVLFAFWGSRFMLAYDAGLYHLQAISWIKDEPIVIGLTNIHDRFGFNSLWLATLAVFWLPVLEIKGVLLANYLPAMFFLIVLFNHLLKIQRVKPDNLSISTIFALLCIAGLCAVPFMFLSHTTSTDLAPNVYTLLSVFFFLRGFESQTLSATEVSKEHMMLWIVAVFAVLTKLSTITPCLLALGFTLCHKDILGFATIRRTAYFLAVVTGVWLLRNFLLSGCLVYPIGLTCADSDFIQWSVGADNAERTRMIVERWARAPGPGYLLNGASVHWIDNWMLNPDRGGQLAKIVRGVSVGSLLGFLFLILSPKTFSIEPVTTNRRALIGASLVAASVIINLLFGFMTAPNPRFWWGSLIALLVLPATIMAYLFFRQRVLIGSRFTFALILLVGFSTGGFVLAKLPALELLAQPIGDFRRVIPEIETKLMPANGIVIHMPLEGDQCWLAPKPCSPTGPQNLSHYQMGPYSVFARKAIEN